MAELYLHQRRIDSVFSLLGEKENDITYSIGWALARSPTFLHRFLQQVLGAGHLPSQHDLKISLQEQGADAGFTDIEIRGVSLHIIVEAKRGWGLPFLKQLEKYVPRFAEMKAQQCLIVSMSECSEEYAHHYLVAEAAGVRVRHVSWSTVAKLTYLSNASHAEKRLMQELRDYLSTIVFMQRQESNWVYVVSLSYKEFAPGLTFVQIVDERGRYFHPYGSGGWPTEPPNYIGFRYDGQLQSIHHIEHAEVIRNFHPHFPECADEEDDPHYLYTLGPAICPPKPVKTGVIWPSGRVEAMLDLLLTCETISEARDKSNERLESASSRR